MKKKILHIEDDLDTMLLVKTLLEKQGYNVSSISNGNNCMNILKEKKIDLVLLDVMLPDISGWDILHRIRENPEHNAVRVAFVSMLHPSETRLNILKKQGIVDYITKPFNNEDLIRRIGKILE